MTSEAVPIGGRSDFDSGWAWLVLIAVYSGIYFLSTIVFMAGVIYVTLLEYYHEDAVKTSLIAALNSGLMCLMGPLASMVMDRFSCRTCMFVGGFLLFVVYSVSAFVNSISLLILLIGIIGGTANALVSTPFVVVLAYYFQKRRNFIIAMSQTLIGVAMFTATPFSLLILDTYGLKGTFLITAGLSAQLCVCALLCRPSSKELQLQKEKTKVNKAHALPEVKQITFSNVKSVMSTFLRTDLIANIPFSAFLISSSSWNFMLGVCLLHLPNYVVTKGMDSSNISFVMFLLSASNTVGRFLGAIFVNQTRVHNITFHLFVLGLGGALTMAFPLYSNQSFAIYIYVACAGLFTGVPNSLLTPITLQLVGLEQLSAAHGLEVFFCGIGFVSGPPVAGLLYERTKSYENSFMVSGVVLVAGCLLAILPYIHVRRQERLGKREAMETDTKSEEVTSMLPT